METSLKTDIHQKTSYHEFINSPKRIRLGTIVKTSWTLSPKVTYSKTLFFDVIRTDTKGRFKIEGTLDLLATNSQPTCTFTKYIEDGQTTISLETKWTIISLYDYNNVEIRGNISISVCAIEDNPSALLQLSNPNALLSNDLLGLLNNTDSFPDATFICGTTKILVHKCILSSRSSVFAAIFKNNKCSIASIGFCAKKTQPTKKKKKHCNDDIFTIEDLEENVFQSTLKYFYSGKTDHISSKFAADILLAAEKYKLDELKSICIDKLKSSMTRKNVIRILLLGNLHDKSLKDTAMEFVCRCDRFSEIEITEPWTSLKKHHPYFALEVLSSLVKYLQRK